MPGMWIRLHACQTSRYLGRVLGMCQEGVGRFVPHKKVPHVEMQCSERHVVPVCTSSLHSSAAVAVHAPGTLSTTGCDNTRPGGAAASAQLHRPGGQITDAQFKFKNGTSAHLGRPAKTKRLPTPGSQREVMSSPQGFGPLGTMPLGRRCLCPALRAQP